MYQVFLCLTYLKRSREGLELRLIQNYHTGILSYLGHDGCDWRLVARNSDFPLLVPGIVALAAGLSDHDIARLV